MLIYLNEALELHNELNSKLWQQNKLKPDVLYKLKQIAEEFLKYIDIPLNVVDIEIVGSNASYNYNDKSDLDLHIIVNSEVNYMNEEILQQFYNSKKNSFNDNYDLTIKDIPIELYIEDVKSTNATNGRYSILKNKWIKQPVPMHYNIPDISQELQQYVEQCEQMLQSDDAEQVNDFVNSLYMMRKLSLEQDGEVGTGNLIFKELRNLDLLQALKDRYYEIRSEQLSE